MGSTWEQEVRAREEENRLAFLAADVVTLDRLWTEDFLVNSPINEVNDKRRTLALLETGRIRHTTMAVEIERMTRHRRHRGRDGERPGDRPAGRDGLTSPLHQSLAARGGRMAVLRAPRERRPVGVHSEGHPDPTIPRLPLSVQPSQTVGAPPATLK
jgi:hypothetical protein